MKNPTNGGRRGRHRRRWTATGLLLGAPALVVPYLLFSQEDSQAATVDANAYYRLVSVNSGKVLDVNGYSTAAGTRIQQWTDQNTPNQQWKLKPTRDGFYELVNRNGGKASHSGRFDRQGGRRRAAERQSVHRPGVADQGRERFPRPSPSPPAGAASSWTSAEAPRPTAGPSSSTPARAAPTSSGSW